MYRSLAIAAGLGCAITCASVDLSDAAELRPAHDPKLCLDVRGGINQPDGTQLIVYGCHGGANQNFSVLPDGTIRVGRRCVDIAGGAARRGDRVIVWPCTGGDNQRWWVGGNGQIVGKNNMCLDVAGFGGSETGIVAWPCKGPQEDASNQQWSIR
jgi:hypothetical protein